MPRMHTLESDAKRKADWFRDMVRNVGQRYSPVSEVETKDVYLGAGRETVAEFTFVDNDTTYRVIVQATDRPEWRESGANLGR